MTKFFRITACCGNGHKQELFVDVILGRRWAEMNAKLLEGSSDIYLHPPGQDSVIGKCGICRGQIACSVDEVER